MYDYHMHSAFSSDTDVPMEAMILSAIQKGLKEICFTDHIDYDYASPEIAFEFDTTVYKNTILALREQYKDQISIRLGIEIGVQPHILDKCTALVNAVEPDFIIASQHTIGRQDLYLGDFYRGRSPEEAIAFGMNELLEIVTHFERFCVVGHIDILKRYNEAVRNTSKAVYLQAVKPVLEALIAKGKGIEVNTSGLRQGLDETLPARELLVLYKELGGEIITIGSDAHNPNDIAHSFEPVLELLQSIGYKSVYRFEGMKPYPIAIATLLNA